MSTDVSPRVQPSPERVTTHAELVAGLRALREQAGLSYRQLEDNALLIGERLSRRTIAALLSATSLPRERTLVAFLRVCGRTPAEILAWRAARRRITSPDRTVSELTGAVEAWVISRWPAGARRSPADLAASVEEWFLRRTRAAQAAAEAAARRRAEETASALGFGQGRLAEVVSQSTDSGRWVGVHRRKRGQLRRRHLRLHTDPA